MAISQIAELTFTQTKYTSAGSAGVNLPVLVGFKFNLYSGWWEMPFWLESW